MTSTPTPSTVEPLEQKLKQFSLPTFPYNGRERNLIDRLLIIGYETKQISKTSLDVIKQHTENPTQCTNGYKMPFQPSVLNSVSYDFSKDFLDDDIIISLIFPDNPYVYYLKNSPPKNINLGTSGIIFSLSPQDNNNSKKSYNGFAYLFYELDRQPQSANQIVAYPKVFCFLSEYPYFSAFYNISEKLYKLFQNDSLTFPLEAVIYNLVKFTPCPLNFSMDLAIWKVVSPSNNNDDTTETTNNTSNDGSNNSNSNLKTSKGSSSKKKVTSSSSTSTSPTVSFLTPSRIPLNDDNYIYFPQISGYPLMHFNLSLFFNIFPAHLIIQVFLFSFLETDILFYSTNLELLNLFMYVISSFNYPCNESIYFWHILSVSIQSFMKGTSTFAGKTCSTIIGINNAYDPNVKTTLRIREHFVFDIDKKEFSYVSSGDVPESENNRIIFEGINRIIANPNSVNGGEITEAIKNFYISLNSLAKKHIQFISNNNNITNTMLNSELFKYDEHIAKNNRSIQNLFYSFMVNIFMLNYDKYKLNKVNNMNTPGGPSDNNMNDNDNDNNNNNIQSSCMYSSSNKNIKSNIYTNNTVLFYTELQTEIDTSNEFELTFVNKFKESSKFGTYFINFMLFYDTIDLFKIPLLFTEEFINRNNTAITDKSQLYTHTKFNYMEMIDHIYYIKTSDDVDKIGTSKKDIKPFHKVITYNEFYNFVENNLKNDFIRQQRTDSDYFDWWILGNNIKTKYKKCEVNNKYLLQYAYMINNLPKDELNQVFPMKSHLNDNIAIKVIQQKTISDIIERNLIKVKGLNKVDYIVYSIFNIFTITRDIAKTEDALFEMNLLINLAKFSSKSNLRKYFMNLLHIYQSLYIKAHNDVVNKERDIQIYIKCYNIIRNYICECNIFPNEEFMYLISNELIPYEEHKATQNEFVISNDIQRDKHSYRANAFFEYQNITEFINEKEKREHERKLWVYSDNIDICSDIYVDVDNDVTSKHSKSKDSRDSLIKGTAMEIICSILGEDEYPKRKVKFFSPLKMYNESSKLVNKYMNVTNGFGDKERTKLKNVIWNLVYYIYLIRVVVGEIRYKERRENEYERFPLEIQNALLSYYVSLVNEAMNKNNKRNEDEDDNMIILSFKDD